MTANVITYRGRSAAREVGKALSIEPAMVDKLAKVMNHFEFVDPNETLDAQPAEVGMDGADPTIQLFGTLWQQIQDLPRHLGQHSGGMVICQGRLDEVVPLENASMPDRVVIQWDKDDCADMGIVKVDLLGLGMMAVLQDALEVVNGAEDRCPMRRIEDRTTDEPGHRPRPRRRPRSRAPPAQRPGRLPDAAGGRHDRDLPGRVARADGDAAAAASRRPSTTSSSRSRSSGPDRSSGRWCIRT